MKRYKSEQERISDIFATRNAKEVKVEEATKEDKEVKKPKKEKEEKK